ncbi:MAG: diaminopimelate dehydrogenase [Bacillota bacterium]
MDKTKVAIVGLGNVGHAAVELVHRAPDMELSGVVRRRLTGDEPRGIRFVTSISDLQPVHVALLCIPTRQVPQTAAELLAAGINTVDSFDLHGQELLRLRADLNQVAVTNQTVAVLGAGWDPGSDSVVRALFEAIAPQGVTYTNFGPGMSMGHSVAVKALPGVVDAVSMTLPMGLGKHKRDVYVQLEDGAELAEVAARIKQDPYFAKDETRVIQVHDVADVYNTGHGVHLERFGATGSAQNQRLKLNMTLTNPATTAQLMVVCARAAVRLSPGAYTMLEVPIIDLLPGSREHIIERLV